MKKRLPGEGAGCLESLLFHDCRGRLLAYSRMPLNGAILSRGSKQHRDRSTRAQPLAAAVPHLLRADALTFLFRQVEIVEEVVDGEALIDGFGTPDDIGNVSVLIPSSVSIITC